MNNEPAPFNDEYFNGLSMEDIAQLAKKSIRLTKQHCDDNHKIEELEEKIDIAVEAFEEIELYRYDVNDIDQEDWFKIATSMAKIAKEAIAKIKEIK